MGKGLGNGGSGYGFGIGGLGCLGSVGSKGTGAGSTQGSVPGKAVLEGCKLDEGKLCDTNKIKPRNSKEVFQMVFLNT